MRQIIINSIAALSALLLFAPGADAQARKKADEATEAWHYDIEPASEAKQGTYVIRVCSYSSRTNPALEQCLKNAVHGVIFKGYSALGNISGKTALAREPGIESQKADFFKPFFADGGDFRKFASQVGDEVERTKVGREVKVCMQVKVMADDLRKYLEAAGIIKGLATGF